MKNRTLYESLKYIHQKGYCWHTHARAVAEFNKIKHLLDEEDRKELKHRLDYISPDNPDSWPEKDGNPDWDLFVYKIQRLQEKYC